MNIQDLIERLQEIAENQPDAEVVLAVQPNYPLRESLRGVAFAEDIIADIHENHEDTEDPMECEECNKERETVWLVSGGQDSSYDANPYAPGWVQEAV